MFLRGTPSPNVSAIISIHGPREFGVEFDAKVPRLDLSFHDVEVPTPGDALAELQAGSRRKWLKEMGRVEVPPTPADTAAIINFATEIRETGGIVLCHCAAGMSRAPAAALICLTVWHGAGHERGCMEKVLAIRPGAVPHRALVRFADQLLKRDGRLVDAVGLGRP
jgi:predicted protein tyrosine phosphatase